MNERFTSDALVFSGSLDDLSILLIRRKYPPFENCYAFPGGFKEENETPEETCIRELFEETNLKLKTSPIPLTPRSRPDRDPRHKTTTYPFLIYLETQEKVKASDDANTAEWIKLKDINDNLAFDHGAILCEAISSFWKGMPNELPNIPHKLYTSKDELIFYGGTFSILHSGHLECVLLCRNYVKNNADIIIVPDYNPTKNMPNNQCFFKFYNHLKEEFKNELVYPGFCGIEFKNPTYSWIKTIKDKQPDKKLSLLIGEDSYRDIDNWVSSSELFKLLHRLYVVPRDLNLTITNKKNVEVIKLPHHDFEKLSASKLKSHNITG